MEFVPFSRVVFRIPYFPYKFINNTHNDKELCNIVENSFVQEALYLASPVLYKELQKLLKGEIKDIKESDRILYSLERYLSRMSTRCTPFGLFAACSIGTISDNTKVEIENTIRRKTRLDMYFLCTLYDQLIKLPEIKSKIKFQPNSSLYKLGKKYRYIEYKYVNNRRKYQITEIEQSTYLNKILKISQNGINLDAITVSLIDDNITEHDASCFVNDLIDSQILVGELGQVVTGDDYLLQIINLLRKIGESRICKVLEQIEELLRCIDRQESNNIILYQSIIDKIKVLNIPYEENYLFQVDSFRNATVSQLGQNVIAEIKSTIKFLNRITPQFENETLNQFKQDFNNRYEGKEVPLLEVLDPESGIGYPSKGKSKDISPLIDNFYLPPQPQKNGITIDDFQSILLKKIIECLSLSKEEIILNDKDVDRVSEFWDDLPPTIYTMCEILNTKHDDVLIKMDSCGGSSGANLLGRFAHIDDNILNLVKDITEKDQELSSSQIVAEITHLPESRIGNILYRPHIRNYELLYITSSDLPPEQLIHLSDLSLSIKQGRLIIYSKRLKKEISPRLTTAHNYRVNPMPVYHFLCDMQTQSRRNSLFFSWGQLSNVFPFRPRVRYRNTILSPALWNIKIEEMKHLFLIKDYNILLSEVDVWRKKAKLPQYVLVSDGDNKLLIDWRNSLNIRSLFSIIKNRQIVTFSEFLFDSKDAIIKNKTECYLNECIIAFHKDNIG